MKISMTAVVLGVALSFAATGCRYDKARRGRGAGADGAGSADGRDIASLEATEGDLSGLSERPFEEYCTRCTDVDFAPVYFAFDSTVVPQGETGKIDAVSGHLAERADRVVVIEGHCDERGSNLYNMSLGENRAIIVRNYLVQNGISPERIQTRSYGEEKPAVEGHDESAWSKNRRGEFVVFQK